MLITSASISQCHTQAASERNGLQDHHHQSAESDGDRHCHHPREDNVPAVQATQTISKATPTYTETRACLLTKQDSGFSQHNT